MSTTPILNKRRIVSIHVHGVFAEGLLLGLENCTLQTLLGSVSAVSAVFPSSDFLKKKISVNHLSGPLSASHACMYVELIPQIGHSFIIFTSF